jgi:hypothetical protein
MVGYCDDNSEASGSITTRNFTIWICTAEGTLHTTESESEISECCMQTWVKYLHSLFIQFTPNLPWHSLEWPNWITNHIQLLILCPYNVILLLKRVIQKLSIWTVQFILQLGILGCPMTCWNSNWTVLQKWLWAKHTSDKDYWLLISQICLDSVFIWPTFYFTLSELTSVASVNKQF